MRHFWTIFILVLFLAACEKSTPEVAVAPLVPDAPQIPKTYTTAAWKEKLEGTFEKSRAEEKDGIEEFTACFEQPEVGEKKCPIFAFGRNDFFKKMFSFQPVYSRFQEFEQTEGALRIHVYAPYCEKPGIVIRPNFLGNKFLAMNWVGILADGTLLVDRSAGDVKREVLEYGKYRVSEAGGFVLTYAEINALRTVATAKNVGVRITGEKGYVALKPKQLDGLRDDLRAALAIYDRLEQALTDVSGSPCS